MIIGNISWNQHKFSNILQKYWQIIPSHTVTLYISEIEISLLTKIFLNLSTISKMNVIRYLTLIDYKGRRGGFLFFDNWAESECWACFVEISYLEADNGDLVLMVTDIMTKMKTVAKLVSAIFQLANLLQKCLQMSYSRMKMTCPSELDCRQVTWQASGDSKPSQSQVFGHLPW